jgi:hypothetical protein
MARTFDAPTSGAGYPNFETALQVGYTQTNYPQLHLGNQTAATFSRTMIQDINNWVPLALNTEDTIHSGYYLYEETKPELIDPGGLVKWDRWYGNIPSTYQTITYESVTFPGYYDSYITDTTNFRPPLTKVVRVTEEHTFALSSDPTPSMKPVMRIQNSIKGYCDYVDDTTTCNLGAFSPNTDPNILTYDDWQDKINETGGATKYFNCKPPTMRRAWGAGNIWEQIVYLADAQ